MPSSYVTSGPVVFSGIFYSAVNHVTGALRPPLSGGVVTPTTINGDHFLSTYGERRSSKHQRYARRRAADMQKALDRKASTKSKLPLFNLAEEYERGCAASRGSIHITVKNTGTAVCNDNNDDDGDDNDDEVVSCDANPQLLCRINSLSVSHLLCDITSR